MVDFKDVLDYCQVKAIQTRLTPTEDSLWRSICREYSRSFNTPLHLVVDMDPEFVILNVYEMRAETLKLDDFKELEEIKDTVMSIADPDYLDNKEKEIDEFVRQAELEEEERLKAGKPIPKPKKTLLKKQEAPPENKPTGGSVNFDYLARLEGEE